MSEARRKGILIIGGGMAGYALAKEIRRLDGEVGLTLVTEDSGGVYSKPMISNALARSSGARDLITQSAEQMALALKARVLPRSRVARLDAAGKRAILESGERIEYGAVALAVGADPIRLSLGGDAAHRALAVNHIEHYDQLRERLDAAGAGARVAIMGAGLIGCEFADDLLGAGFKVALIDPGERALAALCPPEISAGLERALKEKGARLELGKSVVSVCSEESGGKEGLRLELSDGSVERCP